MSDEDYRLWLAEEKKSLADAGYQENITTFDRLKNRTFALLSLSITLCSGSLAGSFSEKSYYFICALMSIGFLISAIFCIIGLYTSNWQTKNIEGDVVDLLVKDIPDKTKTHGIERMSNAVNAVNFANDAAIQKDRQWLKRAWFILILTPLCSFIITIALQFLR